jgi:adenylate cyclase
LLQLQPFARYPHAPAIVSRSTGPKLKEQGFLVAEHRTRKLAVILHADVVGSTALVQRDEALAHKRIQDVFHRFSGTIESYNGRPLELRGDALIAEFSRASDAVESSLAFQAENSRFNSTLADEVQPTLRVGISLGEVVVADNTITGEGIVLAQRLEQLASGGGVCIQGAVYEAVPGRLPFAYESLGEQQLKGFSEPVRAYAVSLKSGETIPPPEVDSMPGEAQRERPRQRWVLVSAMVFLLIAGGGLAWFQPWAPREEPASIEGMVFPLPDKPSIAVLPFTNMSGDPEQEYFADGMVDDLITDLSKISGLFVIARNSTFTYKGKPVKVRQVAEELGVRYVLEGSVRRVDDQIRINAQLIDATTGGHVWAERYDSSLADVFALQDKVTRNVVTALAVNLTTGEQERQARKETDSPKAYDAFLQGWQHYLRQNPENFRKAISYFEKALELDPEYARAYAALAATYMHVWKRYWHAKVGLQYLHDPRFRAEEFLEKALLDPTPLAHQVAAGMLSQQGRHEEAIAEAERAISIDPNDADGYIALASALSLAGRPGEAHQLVQQAMRLNPHYPPFYLYELGIAEFGMVRFAKAAESLERASSLNPDDRWSLRLLLATYGLLGRKEEAAGLLNTVGKSWRGFDPLTVRSVAFWYPFKRSTDAERLAEGLRKAGVAE